MGKKILIVLTSVDQMGNSGKQTGWYLSELAHPYKVLIDAGFEDFDVVSPKGGKCPVDEGSVKAAEGDSVCKWFQSDAKAQALVNNSKTPGQVNASDYDAVMYPGGHGPMFDLASDQIIGKIATDIYEKGGVVAAICHGPAALLVVKLSSGEYLVKGKKLTCFSNAEEDAVQLTDAMPFPLETNLVKEGGVYSKADQMFENHVVVDGKLITGQNPASATQFGKELVKQLK